MASDTSTPTEQPRVKFHYIKSPSYREIACDGAIGGITSKNKIWLAFFAERYPLPRVVEYEGQPIEGTDIAKVDESRPPISVEGQQGIIRNVEVGAYMDLETARSLHTWLGHRIVQMEKKS